MASAEPLRAFLPPDTAATWRAIAPLVPPDAYLVNWYSVRSTSGSLLGSATTTIVVSPLRGMRACTGSAGSDRPLIVVIAVLAALTIQRMRRRP